MFQPDNGSVYVSVAAPGKLPSSEQLINIYSRPSVKIHHRATPCTRTTKLSVRSTIICLSILFILYSQSFMPQLANYNVWVC